MKKVLSILLSICMVSACFIALIPTANAAVSDPSRFPAARKGELIYSEDFEDSDIADKTDSALHSALGWKGTAMSGIKIVKDADSENHRMQIPSSTESMIVCKDNRLKGGGYMIEYTAIMTVAGSSDGQGLGFRSTFDGGSSPKTAGWNFLVKERGVFDFHFHDPGLTSGNRHEETDIAVATDADPNGGSIVGREIRFRLVIDPTYGLSAYTIDLETGKATIVVGMKKDYVADWASYAETLGDEIIIRTIGGTHQIDDLQIYEADSSFYEIPGVIGIQTSRDFQDANAQTYDIRIVSKVEKETEAINMGYLVEYRYKVADPNGDTDKDMVYTNSKEVTCQYVYSSISDKYGQDEYSLSEFNIMALHVNDIPKTRDGVAISITFTITPFATFWSDIGNKEVTQYGTRYVKRITVAG